MTRLIPIALFLLTISLAGCQDVVTVRLKSAAEAIPAPVFTLGFDGSDGQLQLIEVTDAKTGVTVWLATPAEPKRFVDGVYAFNYGAAPAGFKSKVDPALLQPGGTYNLFIEGRRGADAKLTFAVSDSGVISATP